MDRNDNLDYILHRLMADNGRRFALPTSLVEKQRMMRALMNVREPIPASDDFLKAQDAELQQQAEDKGIVKILKDGRMEEWESSIFHFSNFSILLWQGDITRLKVDAIVNAANAQGLGCWAPLHNCIDNCIHSAAGIQLRQECYDQLQSRLLKTGEAIMTRGYNLPAHHVIHTVGPIIETDLPSREQEEQLAQCYHSCLDLAEQHHLLSIAFCCISTGVFHFPNKRAADIALATVKAWHSAHPSSSINQVVFNVFLDKDYDIYRRLLTTN
ncbi:MAG: protein-ADP-ribose hydrolase [Bacteroidaceae bacterium]|nr:protein-ADP-ribose hydrolase [Bacteroidaceae bacterium]